MIIVGQSKKTMTNFNNIEVIECGETEEGKFIVKAYFASGNIVVGTYRTEERAKEVLKEIAEKYEEAKILTNGDSITAVEPPKVYEMPEE